ncbi:AMP-binding protein [Sinimarinibacterium flocculans]|uniref:Fatty-acyl-CoA synthase n=3 Tax=Sinimarinibacterium flocculans TaxID=985250 RepID=A0A318E9U0_9GAMM|nr:AMP-binding protein [Sinimarinibacterium flocculans]PXV68326.1 fatty-acyl-CoA synthase [Sinimarinibacterium flocculans]
MSTDDLHRPRYVPELLVAALDQTPDRPLLELDDGSVLSVGDVRDATGRYVQALQAEGIGRGTRVALLSGTRIEVLFLVNAVQLTAAVYVPLHPLGSLADHAHVLADAGVDLLIFDAARCAERAAALQQRQPALRLLALGDSPLAPDLNACAANHAPRPLQAPTVGPHDILRLGYSGGTTGQPKRIASVQRVGLATVQAMMSQWEWPAAPRFLSCTPLSHAGAAMFLPLLLRGGTMHVLPAFEPVAVMRAIQTHRINCIMLVPTMIYALLDHPRFNAFDLSSLETVFYGASAIAPARLKEAIERIGPVFMQFYGQAEAPMCVTVLRKAEHDVNDLQRLASCGRPAPWVEVSLRDANNQPVSDGEPGEICVRGPLVMDGYHEQPDLTEQAFAGGWLHSGDVAVRDPGGFLRIIDRTKDMIVTGGFNVYPREIEDILTQHPAVSQAAVIGVPHPKWGEAVAAIIVLRDGMHVDAQTLTALVAERKGAYQAPKTVEFVDAIPQTSVGKPDKKALRARYPGN